MHFTFKCTYFQVTKYSSHTICLNEEDLEKKREIHGGKYKFFLSYKLYLNYS